MGTETAIAWTDHTFNPWIGCSKVHTGCTHCYAESFAKRYGKAEWGANGTRVLTSDTNWKLPLKWNREAEKAGIRAKVFCASLADVFEDWPRDKMIQNHSGDALYCDGDGNLTTNRVADGYPHEWPLASLDDVRAKVFGLIRKTPWLDWLVLTKRPENVHRSWPRWRTVASTEPSSINDIRMAKLDNVWLGTSVSDQATADKAIPELLKCRDLAPVLFLSAEPLVGPINFAHIPRYGTHDDTVYFDNCLTGFRATKAGGWTDPKSRVDWVIFGGESGNGARACNVDWIRKGVKQCREGVAVPFVKQLGGYVVGRNDKSFEGDKPEAWPMDTNTTDLEQGWQGQLVHVHLRDKKGGDMSEWPEDLRVQEFPPSNAP